jgi:hypothetical protein
MAGRLVGLVAFFVLTIVSDLVFAKDIPMQVRLFAAGVSADPKNLNQIITSEGIEKVDTVGQFGIEATYPTAKFLDIGLRYSKTAINNEEDPKNAATDYHVKIDQDLALAVVRIPIIKTNLFIADAFAGYGGSNTTIDLKTASQNGELTKKKMAAVGLAQPIRPMVHRLRSALKSFISFLKVASKTIRSLILNARAL